MAELLAKPDKSLLQHTIEVLENSKKLVEIFNINGELHERIFLACALHDIGKATESFQEYIRGKRSKSFPHALASFPFIYIAEMKLYGNPVLASASVVSHHTPLKDLVFEGHGGKVNYLRDEIYEFLHEISEFTGIDIKEPIWKMEKLWLYGKPLDIFRKVRNRDVLINLDVKKYFTVKTLLNLSDWFASGNIKPEVILNKKKELIKQYIENSDFSLREFQKNMIGFHGDVFLKAPTGTGKTEALLLWSKGKRLIYLLPTQATVNAMWKRLRKIYGKDNVGLAHSLSSLILRREGEFEDEKSDMEFRGDLLLSSVFAKPVNVVTLDQYLMAALHGRHWENKAFLVAYSDIVVDEIHSYDAYTLGLLMETLKVFPPERLGMASATFPDALHELLIAEIGKRTEILAEKTLWKRKRHKIYLNEDNLESSLENAIDDADNGKNVLIIANSVTDAQALFEELRDAGFPEDRSMLLHSRFVHRDREEKESFLSQFRSNSDKKGFVLISTQVVEVSLDISFDVLYTEIAPIDALVQRLGRVNRKGEKGISRVNILTDFSKRSARVYGNGDEKAGEEILIRSIDLLKRIPKIPEETNLLRINNELYKHIFSTEDFKERYESGKNKVNEFKEILGTYTINLSDESMRKRFFTRETSVITESVVPCKFRDEVENYIEEGKTWKIPELMVSIPVWWLNEIPKEHITSYVSVADIEYSKDLGALKKISSECSIL